MSSQTLSEPEDEDEDPFASTSTQQDSSGVFVRTHVCIPYKKNSPFCKVVRFHFVGNNDDFIMYSGAKKYLVSHQLCKFSHLKIRGLSFFIILQL